MSRHHILPPIVYTPPAPKPKETKRRRGVGYAGDVDETEETSATTNTAPARGAALPQHQTPVEGAERRLHPTSGNLSEDTLKAMLEMQEQEGGQEAGGGVPVAKP